MTISHGQSAHVFCSMLVGMRLIAIGCIWSDRANTIGPHCGFGRENLRRDCRQETIVTKRDSTSNRQRQGSVVDIGESDYY